VENEINYELVQLGQKAKRILESEDFKDVMAQIQADLFKQFRKTNFADAENREDIHQLSYAVDLLEAKFNSYANAADYEIKTKKEVEDDE
jgi:hypothetical protein